MSSFIDCEKCGTVFWITGLSGAGKTTVAIQLSRMLQDKRGAVIHFDGDQLRDIFQMSDAYDLRSRLDLASRYARLCHTVASQGVDIVCSTISLFPEIHQWNRDNISQYFEVFLRVPMDVLSSRDYSGIYNPIGIKVTKNVVGVDIPYTEPRSPDLIIENDGRYSPDEAASLILSTHEKG